MEEGQEDTDNPWITVKKNKGSSKGGKEKGKGDGEEGASLEEFQKDFKQFWQKQNEEKKRAKARKAAEEDELVRYCENSCLHTFLVSPMALLKNLWLERHSMELFGCSQRCHCKQILLYLLE